MTLEALTKNYYSYKNDLHAIGIMFFEMLTGKLPFKSKTEE